MGTPDELLRPVAPPRSGSSCRAPRAASPPAEAHRSRSADAGLGRDWRVSKLGVAVPGYPLERVVDAGGVAGGGEQLLGVAPPPGLPISVGTLRSSGMDPSDVRVILTRYEAVGKKVHMAASMGRADTQLDGPSPRETATVTISRQLPAPGLLVDTQPGSGQGEPERLKTVASNRIARPPAPSMVDGRIDGQRATRRRTR
jgi:hypothetical protein